ncbi:hypothetical protein B0H14DRAFT_2867998 [Mycena olivaceomarginata]|nr:hypothetical protein B0H14DRAFT_2867998 [Mycena olivaceomarginata]
MQTSWGISLPRAPHSPSPWSDRWLYVSLTNTASSQACPIDERLPIRSRGSSARFRLLRRALSGLNIFETWSQRLRAAISDGASAASRRARRQAWATSIIHPEATCMKEKQEAAHSLHIRKLILHHPRPNSKAFILIIRLVPRVCTISSTSLKTRKSKSRS